MELPNLFSTENITKAAIHQLTPANWLVIVNWPKFVDWLAVTQSNSVNQFWTVERSVFESYLAAFVSLLKSENSFQEESHCWMKSASYCWTKNQDLSAACWLLVQNWAANLNRHETDHCSMCLSSILNGFSLISVYRPGSVSYLFPVTNRVLY